MGDDQIFAYTEPGLAPQGSYVRFAQAFRLSDGSVRLVVRNAAGVGNEVVLPVEAAGELRDALG